MSNIKKSGFLKWVEYALLTLCVCLLVIRTTFTESPHISSFGGSGLLGNDGVSLVITGVIFLAALVWFVFVFGKVGWRVSGVEIGAVCFVIAGVIGAFVASNKRIAITDMVTLAGPMVMAMILVQVLDRGWKIKLVLWLMLGLGVVQTYQCSDQFLYANDMMIEQYESNPEIQLESLGIEPGSFRHMSYEHRLYSKDVKGFFTTGNSAGAFALLAIAAGGVLIAGGKNGRAVSIVLTLLVVLGLVLTHSKGGIGATVLAAGMLGCYWVFGRWLGKCRGVAVVLVLAIVIGAGWAVVHYGNTHEKMPGGNSMLVRWQYWQASAEMYADHAWTGVGGGNFGTHYTQYKNAAAPEVVKDPHNFVLSLLCQYGPLGLIGFIAAVGLPLLGVVFAKNNNDLVEDKTDGPWSKPAAKAIAVTIGVMLTARPFLIKMEGAEDAFEIVYMIFYLYLIPALFFAVPVLLMWAIAKKEPSPNKPVGSVGAVIIFCGVCGVVVGNLVDFAIFEPGVLTAFWVMVGCMVAINRSGEEVCMPSKTARVIGSLTAVGIWVLLMAIAFVPTIKASAMVQKASRGLGDPHKLLRKAVEVDRLSPKAANLHGKVFMQEYAATGKRHRVLLENAERFFRTAIERDKADFKNYSKLSEVYAMLAESSDGEVKIALLAKAYEEQSNAIERYPGSGDLRFEAGKIAEEMGQREKAIEQYEKVVEIEDEYRELFKVMYPGRDMVSRIGEKKYAMAKSKIAELKKKGETP